MQGHCKHYDKKPSLLCCWFLRAFALCWYKTIRGLARAGRGHSAYWPCAAKALCSFFMSPHIVALCVPARGLWKPFPLILSYLFSFSSFLLLSWWWGVSSLVCFEWLIVSLAVIWYVTVLHKSFVSPHAESVASRIKPRILFQGVTTPPSDTSTNQFHYDHGLIRPSVPDRRSPGSREVPGSKSKRPSLHPFPCLSFTSKVPVWAALSCRVTDNICRAAMMEDHFSSSLPPFLSPLLISSLWIYYKQILSNKQNLMHST